MKFLYIFLPCILLIVACESISNSGEGEATDTTMNSRGILDNTEDAANVVSEAPASLTEQLYGTWRLTERKMGVQPLAMEDDDESFLEFNDDGTIIITSNGMEPASADFSTTGQSIISDLYDNPQIIKTISADKLILIEKIDGVDIDYIYTRVK